MSIAKLKAAITATDGEGRMFTLDEARQAIAEIEALEARAAPLPAGDDGELCARLRDIAMRQEHDRPFKAISQAADRIAALNAEVARKDEALAQAATQISDLSRQLGEAQGKMEASELPGIVDGWREKCERLEAEVAALKAEKFKMRAQIMSEMIAADADLYTLGDRHE